MLHEIEMDMAYTSRFTGKVALDSRVMLAMEQVPRHAFLSADFREYAYQNSPQPIGSGQTISQPFIVALMSDLLNTKPSDVVLEIGSGSGYQAAILSKLAAQVYSIEIIEKLAITARNLLKDMEYHNVVIRIGNGYFGWEEHAPYDGIIVTAAAPHVPQPLIKQLRIGARLVIPVGLPKGYQELLVIEKKTEDEVDVRSILGVSFVPLTGSTNNG